MQSTAVPISVTRHPKLTASGTRISPEITTPAGTPVCFIENTSGAHFRGAYSARICELAGVATVVPELIRRTVIAKIGISSSV